MEKPKLKEAYIAFVGKARLDFLTHAACVFVAFSKPSKSRRHTAWCSIEGEKVQRDGDKIGSAAKSDPLVDSYNHMA